MHGFLVDPSLESEKTIRTGGSLETPRNQKKYEKMRCFDHLKKNILGNFAGQDWSSKAHKSHV